MAQYSNDLSGSNPLTRDAGSVNDSTSMVSSPIVIGTQALQVSVGGGGVYIADFATVPNQTINTTAGTNLELLMLMRTPTNGIQISAAVASSGFSVAAYAFLEAGLTNSTLRLISDIEVSTTISGLAINEYFWFQIKKSAGSFTAKVWEYGSSEPGSPQLSRSIPSNFTAAFFGMTVSPGTAYMNWIGVGTAGDPAPRPVTLNLSARDSGVWKTVNNHYVRDGGVWKDAPYWVRDGGVWKKVYG
jgi:hypothetical protein